MNQRAMLLLPVGEVAHLGQVARLAHRVDHPVELGPVGEELGGQREQAREGLVEEDQAAVAAELGDAGRQPVEHVALGADEAGRDRRAPAPGPRRRSHSRRRRSGRAAPRRPASSAARRRPSPARCGATACCWSRTEAASRERARGRRPRRSARCRLRDHRGGILALDRRDIGAVDHGEPEVGAAVPHREGRRLDQAGQRVERGRAPLEPRGQRRRLLLGLGDVDEPEQGRALGEAGRRRAAVDRGRSAPSRPAAAAGGSGRPRRPRRAWRAERGRLGRRERRARRRTAPIQRGGSVARPSAPASRSGPLIVPSGATTSGIAGPAWSSAASRSLSSITDGGSRGAGARRAAAAQTATASQAPETSATTMRREGDTAGIAPCLDAAGGVRKHPRRNKSHSGESRKP